jgi:hypothetical protein
MSEAIKTYRKASGLSEATVRYSRLSELDTPLPRTFSRQSWHRFSRDRRRRYLTDIPGDPTTAQAARIESMVRLEWSALKAEVQGTLMADREAREFRRLYDRLLSDHMRSLEPKLASRRTKTLADHLGSR